jgi:CubicO group peptidase (beta-lactamase class C family)
MFMKKIHLLVAFAVTLVFSLQLVGQNIDEKTFDQYISKAQQDWQVSGMSVGIIKDGKVILAKGYGVLEEGKAQKPDANTLYAIASNTKAFISASIGILVDEGKLKWDDPVQKHLPYFELYDPYVSAKTTVRDLLCHRAGLGTFSGDVIWYKSNFTAEEAIKRVKHLPAAYDFRSGYGYSNLMFITAGEVIKAVSGKTWAEFAEERIFDKTGMARSQTSIVPLTKMKNVATPHKHNAEGITHPIPWVNWDNMGAAGGVISSVNDMLKWCQLQLDNGKVGEDEVFSLRAQETFWKPHNNYTVSARTKEFYPTRHVAGYALGWGYYDHGGRLVYNHGGGYDGMYSQVTLVPEENMAIVILTNSMKGISSGITYYTLDHFFGLEEKDWSSQNLKRTLDWEKSKVERVQERKDKRISGTSPTLKPETYTGIYHDDLYGDIEVVNKEGKMELHFLTAPALNAKLEHWHNDVFEIKWNEEHAWFDFGTVQFLLSNNLTPIELKFDVPNDDIFFEEIHAKKE